MESMMKIEKVSDTESILVDIETGEAMTGSMTHQEALAKHSRIKVLVHLQNAAHGRVWMKYHTLVNRKEAIANLDVKLSDKTLAIFDLMNESFRIRVLAFSSHSIDSECFQKYLIRLSVINTKLTEMIDETGIEKKLLGLAADYERSSNGSARDRSQQVMMEMFGQSAEAICAAINEAKEEGANQ